MLDAAPSDSLWAFARRTDGTYVLAAHLVVVEVDSRANHPEYGQYAVVGDEEKSRLFDVEAGLDAEPIIRSLSIETNAIAQ